MWRSPALRRHGDAKHVGKKTHDKKVKAQRDQDDREDLCNLVGGRAAGAPDHVNGPCFLVLTVWMKELRVREVRATPEPTGRTGTRTHARLKQCSERTVEQGSPEKKDHPLMFTRALR